MILNQQQHEQVRKRQLAIKNFAQHRLDERKDEEVNIEEQNNLIKDGVRNDVDRLLSQSDQKKMAVTECLKKYIDSVEAQAATQVVERSAC